MKSIILRPLAVFTIAFYILSCILFTADRALILWSAVIFSLLLFTALLLKAFIPSLSVISAKTAVFKAVVFLIAGCTLASTVAFYTFEIKLSRYIALCGENVTVKCTVTDVIWDGGYSGIYKVKTEGINGLSSFYCILTAEGGIKENTILSAEVSFSQLENSSHFAEKTYYLSQKVYLKATAESVRVLGEDKLYLTALARYISNSLSEIFYDTLGKEEGAFASALLLGNTSKLSDTVNRDFKRLGISHVLAISGMHLAILCSFVTGLLKPFGKRMINAGCIILVLFYVFVTGFAPTVVRSGIMVLLPVVASNLHKGTDRFTLLGASVFLICIINPLSAGDIGLQLSFVALAAIFLLTENKDMLKIEKADIKALPAPLMKLKEIISSFLSEAFLTAVIILFMLPLEWLYFGQICPVAPLISPVFSILCNILLWSLPVLLLLSPASTIAGVLAYPLKLLISFIITCAQRISSVENVTLSLNYPFAPLFSVLIFAAVLAFCVTKSKKRAIAASVSLLLIISFVVSCTFFSLSKANETTVGMVTYKSNDGLCLVSNNKTMLIDIGNGYSGILNEGSDFFKSTRATETEVIMLTHYHKAYGDSLDTFLSRNIVRQLMVPRDIGKTSQLERICQKHGTDLKYFDPSEEIVFEDATIVPFENTYIERSVQPIVRIDIKAKGKIFTYVGSAYSESAPDAYFDCDYLFIGGHGPLYKKIYTPETREGCAVYCAENAEPFILWTGDISKPSAVVLK